MKPFNDLFEVVPLVVIKRTTKRKTETIANVKMIILQKWNVNVILSPAVVHCFCWPCLCVVFLYFGCLKAPMNVTDSQYN